MVRAVGRRRVGAVHVVRVWWVGWGGGRAGGLWCWWAGMGVYDDGWAVMGYVCMMVVMGMCRVCCQLTGLTMVRARWVMRICGDNVCRVVRVDGDAGDDVSGLGMCVTIGDNGSGAGVCNGYVRYARAMYLCMRDGVCVCITGAVWVSGVYASCARRDRTMRVGMTQAYV